MTGRIGRRQALALAGAALLGLASPVAAQGAQGTAQDGARRAEQAGDASPRQTGSGQPLSDAWLTTKTKLALLADEQVSGTGINVDTSGAVVTLRGEVQSEAQKARAVDVARGIEGVKQVEDRLTVRPSQSGQASGDATAPGASRVARRADEEIAREVRERIQKSWPSGQLRIDGDTLTGPSSTSIAVSVNDGVVTLDGTVQNVEDIVTAAQAARGVQGVRSVKTNIESGQPS